MTTLHQIRRAALGLPETEERTHSGRVAFFVRGRGFASVTAEGVAQLRLAAADVESLRAAHLSAQPLQRSGTVIGVGIPLADIDGQTLNSLVRASWLHRAPKRLAAELTSADAAEPGAGGLPAAIGRPATQALHGAGLTTLELVASRSEAELLALHGVGPKAIRILTETLADRGMALR